MSTETDFYEDTYIASPYVERVMREGRILLENETPHELLVRVTDTLFDVEAQFGTDESSISALKRQFFEFAKNGYFIPGTPTLTNAGRTNRALSSCVVIPVDLRDKEQAYRQIIPYYEQNMGSGFDFTPYGDRVGLLGWLNHVSAQESATGVYERYIGNMGSLHVSHPKIREFIRAKQDHDMPHFNISVVVTDEFMIAAKEGKPFTLADGSSCDARALLEAMAQSAWTNGDPGILSIDRMNDANPIAAISPYTSTPPCGEMGLAPGETCQFGYMKLSKFISYDSETEKTTINYQLLKQATHLLTRALDNAIQVSMEGYPTPESKSMAELKRKIGIGVCGLAELLLEFDLPYDSQDARSLARDVLAHINYESKIASVQLAKDRGSCGAMDNVIDNRFRAENFLSSKFGAQETQTVSSQDWIELGSYIQTEGLLRNIATTALPPTGRASVILQTTPAIEPFFSLYDHEGQMQPAITRWVQRHYPDNHELILSRAQMEGTFSRCTDMSDYHRYCLRTAVEISPHGHMAMVGALAGIRGITDESASKTVNLSQNATATEIYDIFMTAHDLGLKNVAVYRDNSKILQPEVL